ncbi:MAG: hypothetical protein QGD92_11390 [Gammaproteobacteria bacterium]|nr:hypothetical protein [Gammaproteobacteria bacterium]
MPLAGEFQRLALSATVKPMQIVAEFIAGYSLDTTKPDYVANPQYYPRTMGLIESDQDKVYQVRIRYPTESAERAANEKIWDSLVEYFCKKIDANRSTLFFYQQPCSV